MTMTLDPAANVEAPPASAGAGQKSKRERAAGSGGETVVMAATAAVSGLNYLYTHHHDLAAASLPICGGRLGISPSADLRHRRRRVRAVGPRPGGRHVPGRRGPAPESCLLRFGGNLDPGCRGGRSHLPGRG